MGNSTKIAFVVLTCNKNADAGTSNDALQQELEQAIAENRRIDGKWSVEKVTVLEDP